MQELNSIEVDGVSGGFYWIIAAMAVRGVYAAATTSGAQVHSSRMDKMGKL